MSVKAKILKELKENQGSYISGQDLCQRLQVSRTAVWKHIKSLREAGYEIDSVSNRGYCLVHPSGALGAEEILSELQTKWLGRSISYLEMVDSTNLEAKRIAEKGAPHGSLVVAKTQEAGRGRRGRYWESEAGTGIFMSFVLRPDIEVEYSSMITLVTALAVARGIEEVTNLEVGIKWPNDLILHGKKVCGILTELSAQMDELNYLVVGIGINANTPNFPEDVRDVATSLSMECGQKVDMAILIAKVLEKFEFYYELFLETSDLSQVMEEYNQLLVHKDQSIMMIRQNQKVEAISKGINEKGELIVIDSLKRESTIMSGEVSIRGILGYI